MGGFQYKEVVMMTKQCSIIEARHSLGRMIKTLQPGERITLTRRGEAVAIVLTPDEYARLTGNNAVRGGQSLSNFANKTTLWN